MVINEMTEKECTEILSRTSLGRLGCALDNQPYVVPITFAYDGGDFFVLSTFGEKIEWMRSNPKVCVQVDEILSRDQWVSVIANGRYQQFIRVFLSVDFCINSKPTSMGTDHRGAQTASTQ
jgi:uncharacterized protein